MATFTVRIDKSDFKMGLKQVRKFDGVYNGEDQTWTLDTSNAADVLKDPAGYYVVIVSRPAGTETVWVDAEVLGLHDECSEGQSISIRHHGRFGATALDITGVGVTALLGNAAAEMTDAIKDTTEPVTFASVCADSQRLIARLDAISAEWAAKHSVQYEMNDLINPTGRVKIDGIEISSVRAHYSTGEEN